jgi:hypothetical protein
MTNRQAPNTPPHFFGGLGFFFRIERTNLESFRDFLRRRDYFYLEMPIGPVKRESNKTRFR